MNLKQSNILEQFWPKKLQQQIQPESLAQLRASAAEFNYATIKIWGK